MMPRIQFSYDAGDTDPIPRRLHSSVIRDTFCNPNNNCSPVCCCCNLLPIRIAVKGVVWIAIAFSIWEVSMGSWLLIEASCCLRPIVEEDERGLRQISRLRVAGWILIFVGLFRFIGLFYLLYSVSNEDRARKLPTIFYISISLLIGVILTYPMFISIPGKYVLISDGSNLKDFKSVYSTGHTVDLLFMIFYSLYAILYYISITNYQSRNPDEYCDDDGGGNNGSGNILSSSCRNNRFEHINTNVRLTT